MKKILYVCSFMFLMPVLLTACAPSAPPPPKDEVASKQVDDVPRNQRATYEILVVDFSAFYDEYVGPGMKIITSSTLVLPFRQHNKDGHGWILDTEEYRENNRQNGSVFVVKKTIITTEKFNDFLWADENGQVAYNYSEIVVHEGYGTGLWDRMLLLSNSQTYFFKTEEYEVVEIDGVEFYHIKTAFNIYFPNSVRSANVYELWVQVDYQNSFGRMMLIPD